MDGSKDERVGLVLSGGGMRGAYEVGVIEGIVDVLELGEDDPAPFQVVSGTSVGAINAVWVAAWAHRGDVHVDGLRQRWLDLALSSHLRLDPKGAASILGGKTLRRILTDQFGSKGVSFLDPEPFEHLVEREIPWDRLHENVEQGIIDSVAVAALEVSTGRTTVFGETTEGLELEPVEDVRRHFRRGAIEPDHVLASAAIPLLFPARQIEYELFCDGGLRLNTPIPPAIRAGSEKLVVISVGETGEYVHSEGEWARAARRANFPNPIFLAGKAMNAMLVDPVYHELQLTKRINRVIRALDEVLEQEQIDEIQAKIAGDRGAPYRHVPTLDFSPSESIAEVAREFVEEFEPERWSTRALVDLAGGGGVVERDFLSYVFFDGAFARELIELGRRDAHAKADEVETFFS